MAEPQTTDSPLKGRTVNDPRGEAQDEPLTFDSVLGWELFSVQRRRAWLWKQEQAGHAPGDGAAAPAAEPPREEKAPAEPGPAGQPGAAVETAAPAADGRRQATTARRGAVRYAPKPTPQQRALEFDLVGLAFSGGGIRSATFGLGVLQGLAHLGLLRQFDYVSTVSGGGYIGSWLAAWIKREGNPLQVEQQLKPNREKQAQAERLLKKETVVEDEPEPVYHLRAYSNYLSPRLGVFSLDTWTLVSIYLRNLLLNLAILVPTMAALVLVSRLLLRLFCEGQAPGWAEPAAATVAAGLLGFAFWALTADLRHRLDAARARPGGPAGRRPFSLLRLVLTSPPGRLIFGETLTPRQEVTRLLHFLVFYPLLAAAFLLCWVLRSDAVISGWPSFCAALRRDPLLFTALPAGVIGLVLGVFRYMNGVRVVRDAALHQRPNPKRNQRDLLTALYSVLTGWASGALFFLVFATCFWEVPADWRPATVLTLGPPLLLGIVLLGIICEVGLHGRVLEEAAREWWGTVGAYLLVYALAWAAFFGVSLYGGWLVETALGRWAQAGLATTWLTTAVAGALAGHSRQTRNSRGSRTLEWLGVVAPPVFVAGLLVAVSVLVNYLVQGSEGDYWPRLNETGWGPVLFWFLGSVAVALLVGLKVDVNLFSLHGTYANRLIRCYLGASRRKPQWDLRDGDKDRRGGPATLTHPIEDWLPGRGGAPTGNDEAQQRLEDLITGFDPDDDVLLSDLVIGKDHAGSQKSYYGPYPILNTALNLVTGDELAWQERKADSFILTPLFGGSKSTGYRRLPAYNPDRPERSSDLTLGRALAISGAAASPNMGYHSSPPLAFLMTVFNVRLGWWMQNPKWPDWRAASPNRWALILHELLGKTNETGSYVYLSDGGHFENLGVYELVRRRCRFIVVSDAGADPAFAFADLANLIRKCRSDFGIRIDLDVSPIRPQGPDRRSRWHCAVGTVHYDDVDPGAVPGILIYLKASLTGDEPSDVLTYADLNHTFPHQTTADQFFSESQFESYRALGFHVVQEVFGEAIQDSDAKENRRPRAADPEQVRKRLFSRVRRRWFPPPPDLEPNFLESTKAFMEIHETLRRDPSLKQFSQDLYPELTLRRPDTDGNGAAPAPGPREEPKAAEPDRNASELHAVGQMLQVMENAWLGLKLGHYYEHPLNRGWMNVFRRWTNAEAFSKHWPALRGQYSQEFVQFCEKELRLVLWDIEAVRASDDDATRAALERLDVEFAFEWYREDQEGRGLRAMKDNPAKLAQGRHGRPFVWIIWVTNASKYDETADARAALPCGVILLLKPLFDGVSNADRKYEFFVWIDGPYRNQGVGRDPQCVQQALDEVWNELEEVHQGERFCLYVRYPADERTDGDEPLERALWSNFFHYYDFHKVKSAEFGREQDLILACWSDQRARRLETQAVGRRRRRKPQPAP